MRKASRGGNRSYLVNEAEDLNSARNLELKEDNPNAYWEKFEALKVRADTLNKAKADRVQSDQVKVQTNMAKERDLMIQAIPDWLDTGKMNDQWQELSVYLSSNGQDINAITNHTGIVNARKSMLYDRLISQDIEGKRDRTPPKSTTPASPSDIPVSDAAKGRLDALAKTGRRQDAQAVIKDILNRPNTS